MITSKKKKRKKRASWNQQLVAIYEKGWMCRQADVPLTDNPYNGKGNLERQRAQYWRKGWSDADAEIRGA